MRRICHPLIESCSKVGTGDGIIIGVGVVKFAEATEVVSKKGPPKWASFGFPAGCNLKCACPLKVDSTLFGLGSKRNQQEASQFMRPSEWRQSQISSIMLFFSRPLCKHQERRVPNGPALDRRPTSNLRKPYHLCSEASLTRELQLNGALQVVLFWLRCPTLCSLLVQHHLSRICTPPIHSLHTPCCPSF